MSKLDFTIETYKKAIEQVKYYHGEQRRKFTLLPYYTHPLRVASLVAKFKSSHKINKIILAALFHDCLEDTELNYMQLQSMYGPDVAGLVLEVTSDPIRMKKVGKTEYLIDKMQKMSSWALVIKLCDRLDNVLDLVFADDKFIEKYCKETRKILLSLQFSGGRKLSTTHLKIMNEIWNILYMRGYCMTEETEQDQ